MILYLMVQVSHGIPTVEGVFRELDQATKAFVKRSKKLGYERATLGTHPFHSFCMREENKYTLTIVEI